MTYFFVSAVCATDEANPNWDELHRDITALIQSRGFVCHGVRVEPFPGGRMIEHPIAMRNDQFLTVECDVFGRFQKCREDMPPIYNWKRLQMPTRHDEKLMRQREWTDAQAEMYNS